MSDLQEELSQEKLEASQQQQQSQQNNGYYNWPFGFGWLIQLDISPSFSKSGGPVKAADRAACSPFCGVPCAACFSAEKFSFYDLFYFYFYLIFVYIMLYITYFPVIIKIKSFYIFIFFFI